MIEGRGDGEKRLRRRREERDDKKKGRVTRKEVAKKINKV